MYDEFGIEVPITEWNGMRFVRLSIQGYNTRSDVDALLHALREVLPRCR